MTELSLIAFPTRELFVEKIEEFDLIIFDRYRHAGHPADVLPRERGPVCAATAARSWWRRGRSSGRWTASTARPWPRSCRSPPRRRVVEEGFLPAMTDLGRRHPVTEGLDDVPDGAGEGGRWGRWFRMIEVEATGGQVVMDGAGGPPAAGAGPGGRGARRGARLGPRLALGPRLRRRRAAAGTAAAAGALDAEGTGAGGRGADRRPRRAQTLTITRRTIGDAAGRADHHRAGRDRDGGDLARGRAGPLRGWNGRRRTWGCTGWRRAT